METRPRKIEDPHAIIGYQLAHLASWRAQVAYDSRIYQGELSRYGEGLSHVRHLKRQLEISQEQLMHASQDTQELIESLLPPRVIVRGTLAEVTQRDQAKVVELETAILSVVGVSMVLPKPHTAIPVPLISFSSDDRQYEAFYTQIKWEPAADGVEGADG
ncbi:MAG: hypothetical protein WD467_01860 [Candidatus Saccharimonadales bacterium]